jgi:hypothetical protein
MVLARGHNEHPARADPSSCLERRGKIQPPTSAADAVAPRFSPDLRARFLTAAQEVMPLPASCITP